MTTTIKSSMLAVVIALACVSAVSAATSACPVDWSDDTAVGTGIGMTVSCDANTITVSVPNTCVLTEAGFDPTSDLTVNGETGAICADAALTETTTAWTVVFGLDECGTTQSTDGSTSTYTNALSLFTWANSNTENIFRYAYVTIPFTCEYQLTASADLNAFTVPDTNLAGVQVDEAGDFGAVVKVCSDSGCASEIAAGADVNILDDVYVLITTTHALNIQIESLVATDVEAPATSTNTYNLIDSYCDQDGDYGSTYTPGTGTTTYMFKAFQWSDHTTEMFLTLTYTLCDTTGSSTCDDQCATTNPPARRRRGLALLSDQPTETQTLGPWNVVA